MANQLLFTPVRCHLQRHMNTKKFMDTNLESNVCPTSVDHTINERPSERKKNIIRNSQCGNKNQRNLLPMRNRVVCHMRRALLGNVNVLHRATCANPVYTFMAWRLHCTIAHSIINSSFDTFWTRSNSNKNESTTCSVMEWQHIDYVCLQSVKWPPQNTMWE